MNVIIHATIAIKLTAIFSVRGVMLWLINKYVARKNTSDVGKEMSAAITKVNIKNKGNSPQGASSAGEKIIIVDHKVNVPRAILVSHTLIV